MKEPVSLIDIMPTIFDYLGRSELCDKCRGTSLLPLIGGDEVKPEREAAIVSMRVNVMKHYRPWKQSRGDLNVVARRGPWKGIWNAELQSLELYDLERDPDELTNASTTQAALVNELAGRAQAWLKDCQAHAVKSERSVEMDSDTLEELRALGYMN
jgi:arylsulfatase A-like enzyme